MIKVCVIGVGTFGRNLALALSEMGGDVMVIDKAEAAINPLKEKVSYAAIADTTDLESLKELPLKDMDAIVVSIGDDFESCLLTSAHLREVGFKRIFCRAESQTQERILRAMGIHETFSPESLAANRMARTLFLRGVRDSYELAPDHSIVEIGVPKRFVGKSLEELEMRSSYGLLLVSVKRPYDEDDEDGDDEENGDSDAGSNGSERVRILGVIEPDYVFTEEDVLVLFGDEAHIEDFLQLKRAKPEDDTSHT